MKTNVLPMAKKCSCGFVMMRDAWTGWFWMCPNCDIPVHRESMWQEFEREQKNSKGDGSEGPGGQGSAWRSEEGRGTLPGLFPRDGLGL